MIKEKLEQVMQAALEELQKQGKFEVAELPQVVLEHPENAEHGDYATSAAFVVAKQVGKNPNEIAEAIKSKVKSQKSKIIERVEAVDGFVNFFVSQAALQEQLAEALKKKEGFGKNETLKGKKVMIEFTDPNPFKEFHIGHLYSNAVGEAIARILQANGVKLRRVNYQGDVGVHVAKAIWGMQQLKADPRDIEALGKSYAYGSRAYESDMKAKAEIDALNKVIYERCDKRVNELYDTGRATSLKYFEQIYERLGTKFDFYYFERDAGQKGLEVVQENLEKGIFQESKGTVIFPGEKYGLHTRVFINSAGLPTYEAKELGLAPTKYKDFKYDQSIIVTGNEIVEYFKVLIAALKQIYPELGEKTLHLSHGMLRLPGGKMSSRKGNVITGEGLLNEVKERARTLAETSEAGLSAQGKEEVAEKVAVAAVKYSLLRVTLGKDIIFDFEKSLSLDGDSGPYLLYTYARCQSIIRKSKLKNQNSKLQIKIQNFSKGELDILRTIYKFPEMLQEAAEKYAPNLICGFAFDLAQKYNAFYNAHSVLQADTKEQKEFRLALTAACAQIIKTSLTLLGIQTLEKM